MAYLYLVLFCFLLQNINLVSSTVYTCDPDADCGCSKTAAVVDKIVGGEAAVKSSWEWAVSLQILGQHFCGGAVVTPLHIVTAAHCLEYGSTILKYGTVVTAIDDLSQSTTSKAQVRSIARMFVHPEYDDDSNANDIAVLRLEEPLKISHENGTAMLCIPRAPANSIHNYPIVDSSLVAIGWGALDFINSTIPDDLDLQQVTVKAIAADHQMCASSINHEKLQFCAGVIGGGKDTCQGDSGGPLMHFDSVKSRWVLAGITSYGRGCAHPNYAGVYTRVSAYREWLQSIIYDTVVDIAVDTDDEEPIATTATIRTTGITATRTMPITTGAPIISGGSSNLMQPVYSTLLSSRLYGLLSIALYALLT